MIIGGILRAGAPLEPRGLQEQVTNVRLLTEDVGEPARLASSVSSGFVRQQRSGSGLVRDDRSSLLNRGRGRVQEDDWQRLEGRSQGP